MRHRTQEPRKMVRESEYKIWSIGMPVKLGLYFVVVSILNDNFTWHFISINCCPCIVLLTILPFYSYIMCSLCLCSLDESSLHDIHSFDLIH
ncbi:hypothetical protein Scep_005210 [Stephania cephalantha]|uniref:Uncharacterized protein n=1 Tax=Stephania cephalantha TaxID=152367 RepID=A0AAP0PZV8_9MAGN